MALAGPTASTSDRVSGVISPLIGSTSAKRTSAPHNSAAVAVDRKVTAGTTQMSPGPTSNARSARWSAAVPEDEAAAPPAPTLAANAVSNAPTLGPCAR